MFHIVFPDIPHIQSECGKHPRILCGIPSVPQHIVMDMNNVMHEVVSKGIIDYLRSTLTHAHGVAKTAFARIQLRIFIKRFRYDSNRCVLHGFQICF
jgi:hypothetical protein